MSSVNADDRDGLGRVLRRSDGGIPKRDDEVNILCDEIAGQQGRALVAALHPSK
jgi:hypothetical protein